MLIELLLSACLSDGAVIQGTVRVEGSLEPIANATVSITELRRAVTTDSKGYFVIADVAAGEYRVEASAPGHDSHALTIRSGGSGTIRLDFDLSTRPFAIPRVEVTAHIADSASLVTGAPGAGPPAVRVDGNMLRTVPGLAEADVLRGLQLLPSVHAISDFSSALYVRGGAADQNNITLDGVPLFNPYHVGGIFSAINASAVSNVDVWAGAQPARAGGDRLSSTVAIHTRDGGRDRVRAEGAVGLMSAHATVDGPLNGGRGSFLLTGRSTYADAAIGLAERAGWVDFRSPYGFSDAYAKLTHSIGSVGRIAVSGYIDREYVDLVEGGFKGEAGFDWGANMLAVSWRTPIGATVLLESRVGYSDFNGDFLAIENEREAEGDDRWYVDGHSFARNTMAGIDLQRFGNRGTLHAGVSVDWQRFSHAFSTNDNSDLRDLLPDFDHASGARSVSAYVEHEWRPFDAVELRTGMRYLNAGDLGNAWLPRVGARWRLTPAFSLSAGGGRYAQLMRSMRDDQSVASSFVAYDFMTAQPRSVGLATAIDGVVSAEWAGSKGAIRVDLFEKRMRNLILPAEPADPLDAPAFVLDSFVVGTGRARGIEVLARRSFGRTELALSYALSNTTRTTTAQTYTPRFDRTHVLDLSASVALGSSGLFSVRGVIGSGQPYTPATGIVNPFYFDPLAGAWNAGAGRIIAGDLNSARLPGYLRLDVATRKTWTAQWFGRETKLTPYLQIINVLNSRNALIADPQPYSLPHIRFLPQLPVLPTFGLEWKF